MNDKYTKIVYQSNPIGKEKIILYLTTFDLETFEKDEKLEKILTKNNNEQIYIEYIVKSGDNLYSIGKKYSYTPQELIEYNNLSSNILSIGQVLKIPIKKIAKVLDLPELYNENSCITVQRNMYKQEMFRTTIEKFIVETYDEQLEQMQKCIETLRKIKIAPMEYNSNVKNITNSDDVHCKIVEGNITNCNNIYCNEIKGNVINCDKIIYKNGGDE